VTPEQKFGVGVLILIGAIVAGYIVRCVVPARHFPRTAGLLAANAVAAGLAVAGVEPCRLRRIRAGAAYPVLRQLRLPMDGRLR
jgi:hypothetical protein